MFDSTETYEKTEIVQLTIQSKQNTLKTYLYEANQTSFIVHQLHPDDTSLKKSKYYPYDLVHE